MSESTLLHTKKKQSQYTINDKKEKSGGKQRKEGSTYQLAAKMSIDL